MLRDTYSNSANQNQPAPNAKCSKATANASYKTFPPSCGGSNFKEGGSVFMCQDCSWTIESNRSHPLNFISDNQKERFNIVDTSNVSAHPYDGNALFLIKQKLLVNPIAVKPATINNSEYI